MRHPSFSSAATVLTVLLFAMMFASSVQAQSGASPEDFEKGLKLYEGAQYNEAAHAFKRVIDRDRTNAEAYYHLANSYFRMSRNKDAVKAYQRAIELKPDHYLAYNNLGTAYHGLGEFKEAIQSYQEALRLKPDYPEATLGLGVAYLELKDTEAALKQHERLTAIDVERADKLYAYITKKKIPLEILNGKALSLPRPSYPPQARLAHASGVVMVWISIDETGKVVSASAVFGHHLLRPEALQAAMRAQFSPTKVAGKPTRITGIIKYNFVAQ